MSTTRAITLRLEPADYERLEKEAERLGMPPATLARVYVRAGLSNGKETELKQKRQVFLETLGRMTELRDNPDRLDFHPSTQSRWYARAATSWSNGFRGSAGAEGTLR